MRVAIVGLPYSGKTSLFLALSGVPRDHLNPAGENLASVKVPEPRLDLLVELFKPRRRAEATLDFCDLPAAPEEEARAGLSRHLPALRQSDALLIVLRAFRSSSVPDPPDGIDPQRDLQRLREEMLLADLLACDNRLEKLEAALRKHTRDHDQNRREHELLRRCRQALEAETPLREVLRAPDDEKLVRSFGFLTQKPVVTVINVDEEAAGHPPPFADPHAAETLALCARLEAEIAELDPADRSAFLGAYGLTEPARERVIHACFKALDLICFLTVSENEARAWEVRRGTTAIEAAGRIHTDFARGFIRAETVAYKDLKAAGSMRQAKAAGKVRQEPKHYVVQDGDILNIKFNV